MKIFYTSLLALTAVYAAAQTAPYPPSPLIKGIEFEWSSHLRLATGSDNWPITWAADDLSTRFGAMGEASAEPGKFQTE